MEGRISTGRILAGLALALVLTGCAGASPTPPTAALADAVPSAVAETDDVAYESANALLVPGVLDVYAPVKAGAWPVVVMFHGSPPVNTKLSLSSQARLVAEMGFVVFDASWGHAPGGTSGAPTYDELQADLSEAACAIAFARTHATDYGADPATMIVFGHSAGASIGATVAFARPTPTAGCLGGTTLGAIDALVTWDGDWMAIDPVWDKAIAADPRVMDLYTPLKYLAGHKDLRVVMLASEDPAPYARDLNEPPAFASFFAVRDPSGVLRKQLEANGALADGFYDIRELQQLLFLVLKAQGNPVSLDVLPGATHDVMGGEAVPVFLEAFTKAAAAR